MRTRTIEEYVENIHLLEEREGQANTNTLALIMGMRPPTITEVLKKLKAEGYVHYIPHAGETLTAKGKSLAGELGEKHRAIADFLSLIGIERNTAEADACRVEHHVSHETVYRLTRLLRSVQGDPAVSAWFEAFRSDHHDDD
jgi:DtxR family Mn-dependent transcriptional regulator